MPRCEAERSTMSVWYSAEAKDSCRAMYMPRLHVSDTSHMANDTCVARAWQVAMCHAAMYVPRRFVSSPTSSS